MNPIVRNATTESDRVLGRRVELDGIVIGRVKQHDSGRWSAATRNTRRAAVGEPTRAAAVKALLYQAAAAVITPCERENMMAVDPRTAPKLPGWSVKLDGHWIGVYTTLDSAKNFAASGREADWLWVEAGETVRGYRR